MDLPKYKKHKDHDEKIKSTHTAVKALLNPEIANDFYMSYLKGLLSVCIWNLTVVDGKYTTRFRSEGSLLDENKNSLQHEHVIERKYLIEKLLACREDYETILSTAVACVVTVEEHRKLTELSREDKNVQGWERYKKANIKVFDLELGTEHIV